MKAKLSPIQKLDQCPPFLAYALARVGTGDNLHRPSLDTMVKASGLTERTFIRLSQKTEWRSVKIGAAQAFLTACNIDPWAMKDHRAFLRRHAERLPHLSAKQMEILNKRIDPNYKPDAP